MSCFEMLSSVQRIYLGLKYFDPRMFFHYLLNF
uniref:DnaG n=1 Tax=Myoviridae sp. ctCo31 TaxID=2825053 RepID=A0A8S5UM55_9CAUD|nr:MAG TPA: DnaG [Myoviridae sp. ctCo31]